MLVELDMSKAKAATTPGVKEGREDAEDEGLLGPADKATYR